MRGKIDLSSLTYKGVPWLWDKTPADKIMYLTGSWSWYIHPRQAKAYRQLKEELFVRITIETSDTKLATALLALVKSTEAEIERKERADDVARQRRYNAQREREAKRAKRAARKPAKTLREAIDRIPLKTAKPAILAPGGKFRAVKPAKPGTQVEKIRALSAQGLKNNEIAKKLKVNPGTVWHAMHPKK